MKHSTKKSTILTKDYSHLDNNTSVSKEENNSSQATEITYLSMADLTIEKYLEILKAAFLGEKIECGKNI